MAQRARIAHPQKGTRDAPFRARIALTKKGLRDAPSANERGFSL